MRTLAFDGRMGASGDMLLGALLAVGADRDALAPVEAALPIRYAVGTVDRSGVSATRVRVLHTGADEGAGSREGDPIEGTGDHDHDHDHDHEPPNDHDHGHDHAHAEGHGPARTFAEVVDLVEGLDLPADVVENAVAVFRLLGEAEARVHGVDLAETHFHEVGADDAIADVVGVCLLVADLAPDRILTAPVSTGGGEVTMDHGTYPIPPPAVVELAGAAEWSIRGGPVEGELLTPTGAALLAHFAAGTPTIPPIAVTHSGYGAGARDYPDRPNVLRAILGEATEPAVEGAAAAAAGATDGGLRRDEIVVLETNLDDASPEVLGGLQEALAAAGARDVTVIPATMKKSRPGHVVQVIARPDDAERLARRLAEETGTLGVRAGPATHRWIAERAVETATIEVDGDPFEVAVKVASDAAGTVYDVSAEYDDAAAVARETGLPTREVMRRAEAALREGRD